MGQGDCPVRGESKGIKPLPGFQATALRLRSEPLTRRSEAQKPGDPGHAFRSMDFSLFKNIRTTESTYLQLRAEFFNLTSSPSFAKPSCMNFSDTLNYRRISGTVGSPQEI